MTDISGEQRPVKQLCDNCGREQDAGEKICRGCGGSHFVVPEQPQPEVTPPGHAQPDSPPPVSTTNADAVAAARVRHLVASFTTNRDATFHHELAAGECVTLGRYPEQSPLADRLAADDSVSRLHAELEFGQDGRVCLTDKGSLNGTFVNGDRLAKGSLRELTERDRIVLGEHTQVRIRIVAGPARTSGHEGGHS